MSRSAHGFTLIEVLTVIAVIAVLALLIFPASSRVLEAERASACVSNLRGIGMALQAYLGDHDQVMPTLLAGRQTTSQNVPVIDNTLNTYAPDPRIFACPSDNKGLAAATGTSYYWNSALNGQSANHLQFLLANGQNSEIPILSDKEGFHPYASNKVNLLYADGHASQNLSFVTSQ